jgi:hypothetical protein
MLQYKCTVINFSLWVSFPASVPSILWSLNILLSPDSSFNVRDQVTQPHKRAGKISVTYVRMYFKIVAYLYELSD